MAPTFLSALLLHAAACAHALPSPLPSLEDAIREVVLPLLKNQSVSMNNSAWGFSYVDATTRVSLCAGYSDIVSKTPCSTNDMHAWGSTTKVQTAVLIMQLVEQGKLKLDDSIVTHADSYVQHISHGATSLVSLFGPQIHNVTIRHLLQMQSGILEYDNKDLRHYQNVNRAEDLDPLWILNYTNRTFDCAPGTCGKYSSTNYVILGLVLAHYTGAPDWDGFDQRSWIPPLSPHSSFQDMYYPIHGCCSNFSSADPRRKGRTMHGYQKGKYVEKGIVPNQEDLDVDSMSCLQGWTCGNLVAPTMSVADFFWALLGPPSTDATSALLHTDSVKEMLAFQPGPYLGDTVFGYGLGMMNFTSMNWGFQDAGLFYGHNGLTYGFGAQSGYHADLEFSVTWNNNVEYWIGHTDAGKGTDKVYAGLVEVVKKYRAASRQAGLMLV